MAAEAQHITVRKTLPVIVWERLRKAAEKEKAAQNIAYLIVAMAGVALLFLLYEGFHVINLSIDKPEIAQKIITESVIPLVEKIATFFTTVFGPLLAFILGYYFAQRDAQVRAEDRDSPNAMSLPKRRAGDKHPQGTPQGRDGDEGPRRTAEGPAEDRKP